VGVVVALGNFDGVHLGHQAVLRRAVEEARARGARVVVATFRPHPRAVLWPGTEPALLTDTALRREAVVRYGASEMVEIPFDVELSRKSPGEFVRDVVVGKLGAEAVVVGENFRFGHKASGDVGDLDRHMREAGGAAYAVAVTGGADSGAISSSRIRALLAEGRVEEAAALLGRPYVLRGVVIEGDRRGRTIGFPTANVLPPPEALVPARGVYASRVRVGEEWHPACTNVGVAPTFGERESRVEAHLIDYSGELYGRVIDVSFEARIRGELRFAGVEELRAKISEDVEAARRLLEGG
jgi:riboflavin kinase / FMN adenylyltransferase